METTARENSEEVLCPSCMRGNAVKAHFCEHCRAPLDSFAATDPIGSIYAEFHTIGKASHKPRNGVVLVGMWLILGPGFIGSGIMTFGLPYSLGDAWGDPKKMVLTLVSIAIVGVIAVVSGILLWRTTANYFGKGEDVEEEEKNDGLAEEALAGGGDGDGGDTVE